MTALDASDVGHRIDGLADLLAATGALTDPAWRTAMHGVPRHLFVPPVAWADPYDAPGHRIDSAAAPSAWLDATYANQPIITQYDDGHTPLADGGGDCSSSLSAPDVVFACLELLDLERLGGEGRTRVLEIGSGSGWTAGLLSARVGAANVTSIEVDEQVAARAATNLANAGHRPRLIVGEGSHGDPAGAPYDALHVTCGVTTLPYEWVRQTRPGGVIVFPWMPEYGPGRLVRLVVDEHGCASGTFHGTASYMMLRSQRTSFPVIDATTPGFEETTATTDVRRVIWNVPGPAIAITGAVPDLMATHAVDPADGSVRLWLADTGHSSAAIVDAPWGTSEARVRQRGPRRLWDELRGAHRAWTEHGSPGHDRFGLSVGPGGQFVWLDAPDRPVTGGSGSGGAD